MSLERALSRLPEADESATAGEEKQWPSPPCLRSMRICAASTSTLCWPRKSLRCATWRNLLKRENEVLGAKNVAAIERAALVRQQMMGDLARTEEQTPLLVHHARLHARLGWLESLMQWCDPEGTLLSRLRECAKRATHCRDLNDKNGILVAARLKHVEGRLSALTASANQPVTYGPNGSAPKVKPLPRMGRGVNCRRRHGGRAIPLSQPRASRSDSISAADSAMKPSQAFASNFSFCSGLAQ